MKLLFVIFCSGYLKIYQLNRPVLDGYDCLLVDEAQDCTPGKIIIVYLLSRELIIAVMFCQVFFFFCGRQLLYKGILFEKQG